MNSNCTFVIKWQPQSTFINFQMIYSIKPINTAYFYAALGFSYDSLMGNDSVCMCRAFNNSYYVETYFNDYNNPVDPRFKSDVLITQNRSVGLFNSTLTLSNSTLICSFSRIISIHGLDNFFNLSNSFNILLAYGETNSLSNYSLFIFILKIIVIIYIYTGSPIYHGHNSIASVNRQSFQSLKSSNLNSTSTTAATATTTTTTKSLNHAHTFKTNFKIYLFHILFLIFIN